MVVLHIASIENNLLNGVCATVPQHITAQRKYAQVGLINMNPVRIHGLKDEEQLPFSKRFHVRELPEPFYHPDLVVFHECYRLPYLKMAKEFEKNNIPYIIIPHGELSKIAQQKSHFKKAIANRLLFQRFIEHARAVFFLSKNEQENSRFGQKKICITNGVCVPEKRKTEFHTKKVKIIYIGRLDVFYKGLDLMVEAVTLIADRMLDKNATIDIYGPDVRGGFAHVQALIEKAGMEKIFRLHSEVLGKGKEELLMDADVFIQTSRSEGMPLGILEALSYGLPCIVTKGTNLSEEITTAAAGWDSGSDSSSIAKALLQALEEQKFYRIYGEHGRKLVSTKFSWDTIGKQTIEEFSKLID